MVNEPDQARVKLIVVDDDDVDIMAIKRAMRKLDMAQPLHTAHNGLEALRLLRGSDDGSSDRLSEPFVIVLDLNMPMMNGIDFLDEIRADESLRESIVFVLSTSESTEDKHRAYQRNVAGYIVKAKSSNAYLDALRMIDSYCSVVELPGVA